MKLKLLVVLAIAAGCLALTTAHHPAPAFAPNDFKAPLDGTDPPHAVETSGKALPNESASQPDKPVILAKDSEDSRWGELKTEAAFDHTKHATDTMYSLDGKTVTTCVECHHTEQPLAPVGKKYLKKFERKEELTAKQLESSKQPVKSCRACHFSPASEETDEFPPQGITYPKELSRPPSGKLTNDVAYHLKCISCHDAARKRDPQLKSPQQCAECHVKKS